MSKLHTKILQDAMVIIESGELRHACNAIKRAVNWHHSSTDPDEVKAAQEIISHIMQIISPDTTFDNFLYNKKIINGNEWDASYSSCSNNPSKVKRMRLEWMQNIMEYFEKKLDE